MLSSIYREVFLHSLLLVTCSRDYADTSAEARQYVYHTLQKKPLFVNDEPGDIFVCDWFVIGGRFSGILTRFAKPTTLSHKQRGIHRDFGYADDAMLLDQTLYLRLLAQYEGRAVGRRMDQLAFLDLDGERVSPEFVQRKWVVVVDYHS